MSAQPISENHIRYLINAGMSRRLNVHGFHWNAPGELTHGLHRIETEPADLVRLGQLLWNENYRAINHRYRNERGDAPPYQHRRHSDTDLAIDPLTVLKLIDGYEYNCNEHDDWETSEAFAFCQSLRKVAIAAIAGYDDLPWTI